MCHGMWKLLAYGSATEEVRQLEQAPECVQGLSQGRHEGYERAGRKGGRQALPLPSRGARYFRRRISETLMTQQNRNEGQRQDNSEVSQQGGSQRQGGQGQQEQQGGNQNQQGGSQRQGSQGQGSQGQQQQDRGGQGQQQGSGQQRDGSQGSSRQSGDRGDDASVNRDPGRSDQQN